GFSPLQCRFFIFHSFKPPAFAEFSAFFLFCSEESKIYNLFLKLICSLKELNSSFLPSLAHSPAPIEV
ncbi:hypothetical protein ACHRVK_06580, partial [Flavobacterium plurextorum]|uniref:hypothetical protein n=1 Tax=Flavobacterium plurextorum TaxID=1114867 RepID=UPI003757ED62